MGVVYLARQEGLDRAAALKLLPNPADTDARARFLREAKAMARVEHPNVLRVYAFGESKGVPWLAMEYAAGGTLSERLRRDGALPISEAVRIAREIAEGLRAANESGLVHRDVKPSNVLFDARGTVRVADFGLARQIDISTSSDLTSSGQILGTPQYLAPEQAQGGHVDHRADIYSLGIVLWEMLSGKRPFDGATPYAIIEQHVRKPLPRIDHLITGVPEDLASLVQDMTAKLPEDRPSDYAVLLARLDALHPSRQKSTILSPLTHSRRYRMRTIVLLAVLALGITALLGTSLCRLATEIFASSRLVQPLSPLVVAVAPFYGANSDAAREGATMSQLIERAVVDRLGKHGVRLIGHTQIKDPVRDHQSARALGMKLGANVVVWGETYVSKGEVAHQPYFTLVFNADPNQDRFRPPQGTADQRLVEQQERAGILIEKSTPSQSQFALLSTSASGAGDLVTRLAAVYALYVELEPKKTLTLLEDLAPSSETVILRAAAYEQMGHLKEAHDTLQQAVGTGSTDDRLYAALGDLSVHQHDWQGAVDWYTRAQGLNPAFFSHRGTLFENGLCTAEGYTWAGRYVSSDALLCRDLRTFRVLRRLRLPGPPVAFQLRQGALEVTYGVLRAAPGTVTVRHWALDRPLYLGSNLVIRLQSLRAGWALAYNYLGELTGMPQRPGNPRARFVLRTQDIDATLPITLPTLQVALENAVVEDPTQPWYLFWLGETLWAEGHYENANSKWAAILREPHESATADDFSWMTCFFELLNQPVWADKAWEEAKRRRELLLQPVFETSLIERLISFPVYRRAAWLAAAGIDEGRAFDWIARADEITGSCPGCCESLALPAWVSYFRSSGDQKRLRSALELQRRLSATSDEPRVRALADLSTILFYLLVCCALLLAARELEITARERRAVAPERSRTGWGPIRALAFEKLVPRLPYLVAAVAIIALAVLWWTGSDPALDVLAPTICALGLLLWWQWTGRHAPTKDFERYPHRTETILRRVVLAVAVGACAAVIVLSGWQFKLINEPIGCADSLGHRSMVDYWKWRLTVAPTLPVKWIAAVAFQLSGDDERAQELYGSLSDHHTGAASNLESLAGGSSRPVVMPTLADLRAAIPPATGREWAAFTVQAVAGVEHSNSGDLQVPPLSSALLFLLLFELVCIVGRESRSRSPYNSKPQHSVPATLTTDQPSADTRIARLLHVLPVAIVISALILVFGGYHFMATVGRFPAIGWMASAGMPNLANFLALPCTSPGGCPDPLASNYWAMFLSLPGSSVLLVSLASAAAIFLGSTSWLLALVLGRRRHRS